eukprot:TRINITY_DN8087_c0_g1_i1.p1 TRINITY_DN8087_c0_g1~~TRINITY_DN8087_c0_g1_i1.p1  ORF type:complete len:322 (-),score=58.67 TRINITY_DN8087_c0_g1_i1:1715-2680(-)
MVGLPSWTWDSGGWRQYDPNWKVLVLIAITGCGLVSGRKNENYAVSQVCSESKDGNFMSNIPKTVDGVVLDSRDERDEDCVISFQTESILEKFLLKFDRLHMDCHDHLYIYDGAHATGAWRAHISCDSEPSSVGSKGFIITRTNFVTLRYQTDSWGTENNGFTLIITAFKNSQTFGCTDGFECDSFLCISSDLVCDNVSHCGHGEDETANNNCSGSSLYALLGLEVGQVIGAASLLLLLLVSGGTAAWIWTCRQDRERQTRELLVANNYNMSGNDENGHRMSHGLSGGVTTVIERNGSGNMHLPAQGQGYKHIRQTPCLGG